MLLYVQYARMYVYACMKYKMYACQTQLKSRYDLHISKSPLSSLHIAIAVSSTTEKVRVAVLLLVLTLPVIRLTSQTSAAIIKWTKWQTYLLAFQLHKQQQLQKY